MNRFNSILCFFLLCFLFSFSQEIKINVDFDQNLQYDKVKEFDRSKFISIHAAPYGAFSDSERDYLNELGVHYGRGFFSLGAGGVIASGELYEEKLMKEAKNFRNWLKDKVNSKKDYSDIIATAHATPKSWNYAFHWKGNNANYNEEAEYISKFLLANYGSFDDINIPMPGYFEPMNEPFVKIWDYPGVNPDSVLKEMCNYHKQIARKLHKVIPGLLIGGPTEAWPAFEMFQNSDFSNWNSRFKIFMDIAGEDMDFFSIHIYDGVNMAGGDVTRTGSNLEAILDMVEAYSYIKWGKIKPIIISEHGYTDGEIEKTLYSPLRDWKSISSINSQLMQFIQRPQYLLKSIPFIMDRSTFFKGYNGNGSPFPWAISRRVEGENWQWTHLIKVYELWKNVSGDYVSTTSSNPDILVNAFRKKSKAFLVLNNIDTCEQHVSLNYKTEFENIKSVKIRRLYLENDTPILTEKTTDKNTLNLKIAKKETIVLEIDFQKKVAESKPFIVKKFYSEEYLKPILQNTVNEFHIYKVPNNCTNAVLRLGIARAIGLSLQPLVKVNGHKIEVPTNWKGYDQKPRTKEGFFGIIEIDVPVEFLKTENKVEIVFNEKNGTLSTACLQVQVQ